MTCANCANDDLVAIHLTISSEEVALYRCPHCDTRVWSGSDGELSKEGVLELVRSSR